MGNINSTNDEILWGKGIQVKHKGFNMLSKLLKDQRYGTTPTARAVEKFSTKLLELLHESSEQNNQVVSALGIELLLAMYVEGMTASTRECHTLHSSLNTKCNQRLNYASLSKKLSSIDRDSFIFAIKIYFKDGSPLPFFLPNFRKVISSYQMEMESIDFETPFEAAGIMNKWAAMITKNRIKRPVPAIFLLRGMLSAALNVIFFKGHWRVKFDVKDTRNLIFFLDEERAVQKPIMTVLDHKHLRYSESKVLGARLLELPYREKGFRMIIFLPDKVDGLSDVIKKANKYGVLDEITRVALPDAEVHLRLPKFKVETNTSGVQWRQDMEVLLSQLRGSYVSSKEYPTTEVVIDQYFQKAVLDVEEAGTNVDGVTVETKKAERRSSSTPPECIQFFVDRPFLFVLLYEDIIFLVGTYAG